MTEPLTEPTFLIWSEEYGAWWRAGSNGYTKSVFDAGRYTLREAMDITAAANFTGKINEVALFAILLSP